MKFFILSDYHAPPYGGPDGELGASLRYLSQRFSMPYPELKGLLTDVGTEEYAQRCYKLTILHFFTSPETLLKSTKIQSTCWKTISICADYMRPIRYQ